MATIGVVVTADGMAIPDYDDILQQIRNFYWSVYGSDADLGSDTQDGQFLAILALAIYNSNQTAQSAYNSFSPATAQGVALSSIVKINGLRRKVATNSQAVVSVGGAAFTTITAGQIGSTLNDGLVWNLPDTVDIPDAGFIDVTATCQSVGSNAAPANSLTRILTPTRGWQSVTNAAAASPGAPVESDATLRQRQAASTSLPAKSVIEAIFGAVDAISGVSRLQIYENQDDPPDANGIPGHSISVVVLGGDAATIAETIAGSKTPGTGTYGNISTVVFDSRGMPSTIKFFELTQVALKVEVDVIPLVGYTSAIGAQIVAAVVAFTNSAAIGEDSYLARLTAAASLGGVGPGATFVVSAVRQSRDGNPPAAANVVISFREVSTLALSDVTLATV